MSSTYAGTATYPTNITIPDDGDPRDVASVNVAFEGLADRDTFLRVRYVALYANTAALKAVTGMVDGQYGVIEGIGLFVYNDPDATAESLPWVVAPTSGTGRWVHTLNSVKGASPGLATLDGTGKVPIAQIPGSSVVTAVGNTTDIGFTTTSTTYVDVTGSVYTLGAVAGDQIIVQAHAELFARRGAGAGGTGVYSVTIVDGATTTRREYSTRPTLYLTSMTWVYAVANTGTVTVKMELKNNADSVGDQSEVSVGSISAIRARQ